MIQLYYKCCKPESMLNLLLALSILFDTLSSDYIVHTIISVTGTTENFRMPRRNKGARKYFSKPLKGHKRYGALKVCTSLSHV